MKIRIQVPAYLGEYKLNKQARRVAAKKLIERNLKLFAKTQQKVSEVILIVDDKEYIIKLKSEEQTLIEHTEILLNK